MKRKAQKNFPIRLAVSLAVLFILIAAAGEFFHQTEGWDRLDSVYFSVITFTTIGYGDMTPTTDLAKVGTMVFSILGIAVAFHFLVLFGSYVFEKKLSTEKKRVKQDLRENNNSKKNKKSSKNKSSKKSKS